MCFQIRIVPQDWVSFCSSEKKVFELWDIPPSPAEPSLPVVCQEKPNDSAKELDLIDSLSDIKGGQGDALSLPESFLYAQPTPGQHLLQHQV